MEAPPRVNSLIPEVCKRIQTDLRCKLKKNKVIERSVRDVKTGALTGEMTWEVNGSARCKNMIMENWAHGRGVFLIGFEVLFALPLMLGALLLWLEDPASVAASESGGDPKMTPSIAETLLPPSRGVSSSGVVGITTVMLSRSVGGGRKKVGEERGRWKGRWRFSIFEK